MDGSASDGGERKRAGLHAESEQGHFRTSAPAKLIRASSGLGLRAPPSRTPIVQAPARPITPGPGPVKAPGSRAAAGRRAAMRSTLDAGGRPVRCAARAADEPEFAPARLGDLRASAVDSSRASAELGWAPAFDLGTGIGATVEYFRRS